MGCNTGGSRGRTESTAQTVQSCRARISLTFFKQRTKLAASSISPLLHSKRPPELLAALKSIAALEFQFLSLLPLVTIPYSLETGSREVTGLKWILDGGHNLPFPDGLLINGRGWNGYTFAVDQGKTYRFRISNVGTSTSINFRIQGHAMKLVEVEGSHTLQNTYSSLDVHLGQSLSVLVIADQPPKDYYIVVSSRFTSPVLTTTAILHYRNSFTTVSGPPPGGPTIDIGSSLSQARSIRWNLTASGPRPNPQGSYHYGMIKTSRTIVLANSAPYINGKQRYAVNSVSYVPADTPLKLADYFNIGGVFNLGSIPDNPSYGNGYLATSVMAADFRAFVEIVFQNWEDSVQSWHIDGYSFFVVGCIPGHGQQSTWLWTMLGCGTSGQRTGQGNTWANSSTSGFTPLPIHGGMNYLSPRMPFFVAGPPVTTLGLFDFGWPSFRSREGDCQRGFSAGINLSSELELELLE
ncbi:hypothetical protein C3L33_15376, partial [Rhododendron williamsianum]